MDKQEVLYSPEQMEQIEEYVEKAFGKNDEAFIVHELASEYVHTDILFGGDGKADNYIISMGMGARETHSPLKEFEHIELIMKYSDGLSLRDDNTRKRLITAIGQLRELTKYPFRYDSWLGPGHTINASDDFAEDFGYQYFMFVENHNTAEIEGIGEIHFLLLIPIYEDEYNWIVSHEDGSQIFLNWYLEYYDDDDSDMLKIDIPRPHIIPPTWGELED